ncbi:hypothetical protein BDV97DRAFT_355421 [Delphinella strobiligena]|nr:hypothetical protein BDV97DRAFT_355421 [Delphinella strobiligena]
MQRTFIRPLQTLNQAPRLPRSFAPRSFHSPSIRLAQNMTTAEFRYIDPTSYDAKATAAFEKPWSKVDGPGYSFRLKDHERSVENIRGNEANFSTDKSGFAVYHHPAQEKAFTDDQAVRDGYYAEVEELLRQKLPGVKKVVIFDHTIRRREKASPRQPVQQVHVDQTPQAAETRVRRHVPGDEAEELLKGRYQLINVWRPIQNPASDFPLAVIDWRTTDPSDFVKVDLLYPKRQDSAVDDDDRGKEALPDPNSITSTQGYEVKGETFAVAPSDKHRFFYMKDMTPEEVMFIKCFDSRSQWFGQQGVAHCTPHTAFVDPQTLKEAPGRLSIEVRCLVFQE